MQVISELSSDESSLYWFPELTVNSLVSNEIAFNQFEREKPPVRCVSLISHSVVNGPVYNGGDFMIKSNNSNIQNFVLALHATRNSSSRLFLGDSSYFGLKDNISRETPLNGDICREGGTYSCLLWKGTATHAAPCTGRPWTATRI